MRSGAAGRAIDPEPFERANADQEGPSRSYWPARTAPRVAFGLLALVLASLLLGRPLLISTAALLDVGEAPVPADLIYLLGGDVFARTPTAAELFDQRFAPQLLLARVRETGASRFGIYPNETDATRALLVAYGVPDTAIVMIRGGTGVASTTDEARVLRDYLAENPADRVLVVTNDYHTRRARWNFRRQLSGTPVEITMVSAPHPDFNRWDWWRSEDGVIAYMQEYVKFVHNFIFR